MAGMMARLHCPATMEACLLALDTSTEVLAVGLHSAAGQICRVEAGGALSSARLIPLAQAVLAEAGLTWAQLDAIAFGAGPGAFTGLRTACAVAQGLGFGAGKPLIALDSLRIVAEDAAWQRNEPDPPDTWHWVAMDARMDEVYAGAYRRSANDAAWAVAAAPALYTLAALAARWADTPPQRLAGNAAAVFGPRLPCTGALRVDAVADRAGAMLRLARQAWVSGELLDPADALPLYLRDRVALTTAQRDEAREQARVLTAPAPEATP